MSAQLPAYGEWLPVIPSSQQMGDIFVARGTPVVVVTRAVGHDKHIWGEETDEFNPEH